MEKRKEAVKEGASRKSLSCIGLTSLESHQNLFSAIGNGRMWFIAHGTVGMV